MAYEGSKSARDNFWKFIYHFQADMSEIRVDPAMD